MLTAGDDGSCDSVSMVLSERDGRVFSGRARMVSNSKLGSAAAAACLLSWKEPPGGVVAVTEPRGEELELGVGDWDQTSDGRRVRTSGRLKMTSSFSDFADATAGWLAGFPVSSEGDGSATRSTSSAGTRGLAAAGRFLSEDRTVLVFLGTAVVEAVDEAEAARWSRDAAGRRRGLRRSPMLRLWFKLSRDGAARREAVRGTGRRDGLGMPLGRVEAAAERFSSMVTHAGSRAAACSACWMAGGIVGSSGCTGCNNVHGLWVAS